MNKLWIIIRREYLTRIRKRSFILGTILAPLGMLLYVGVIYWMNTYKSSDEIRVAVYDPANITQSLPDEDGVRYFKPQASDLEGLKAEVKEGKYNGLLHIPSLSSEKSTKHTVFYFSENKLSPEQERRIERRIERKIREYKINKQNLNEEQIAQLDTDVYIDPENLDGTEDTDSSITTGIAVGIGFVMAFIMFFMVLMYGQMVMRSVMEEKTNRIVEVMMSSVRPFQLMLGKIIGSGLVGFTQAILWILSTWGIYALAFAIFGGDAFAAGSSGMESMAANPQVDVEEAQGMAARIMAEVGNQNWWYLLSFFLLYFLGGYLIYSSLFAAIGSTISDDLGEGQSLTLPVTIPIILAFYLISFAGMRDPNSSLMVFGSIFPLFSPIVMPFRLAFDPPLWQILLSVACLILGTLFFVWLAGRIYRIGILLYGKRASFKEIGKWLLHP